MQEVLDLKNAAENVVSSYMTMVESVEGVFDTTLQLPDGLQESFLDNKEERRKISAELRDILANNEHLRKKDFDSMMQVGFSTQEEQETEVKKLLKSYLEQQREMACTLRENLSKFKEALVQRDVQRVKEFQVMVKDILANQEIRKEETIAKLKEFQKEQQEMAKRLKELLTKGNRLRIKDFKEMLQEFKARQKERLTYRVERRQEVNKMLGIFKQKRQESAKNWQNKIQINI